MGIFKSAPHGSRLDVSERPVCAGQPAQPANHILTLLSKRRGRWTAPCVSSCSGRIDLMLRLWRRLSSGHRLPSRVGIYDDVGRSIIVQRIGREVGFKFGQRQTFPFPGLAQKRAPLIGTEARGLTVQRSNGSISAHVFQDGFPARMHEFGLPLFSPC